MASSPSVPRKKVRRQSAWAGALFLAPALILVVLFLVVPVGYTIRLSMAKGPGFNLNGFVGLANYQKLARDPAFFSTADGLSGALINSTMWMLFALPACILIGLAVAMVADKNKFEYIIRGAFFLPMVLSGTVLGIIWLFVFSPSPELGLLNATLRTDRSWLGDPTTVNPALMASWVWAATGLSVVIIAAALKGVSEDLLEAARLDGANARQVFWHVTLPSIRLPLSFLLTTQLVQVLKVFDVVYVMTNGGPAGASRTMALMFYEQTFSSLKPQYGAAVVTVMSIVIIIAYLLARSTGKDATNG